MTECFSSAALMTIGLVRKDDLNRFYSVTSGWIMRDICSLVTISSFWQRINEQDFVKGQKEGVL